MQELKITVLIEEKVRQLEAAVDQLKKGSSNTNERLREIDFLVRGIDGKNGLREDVDQLIKEKNMWRNALILFAALGSVGTVISLLLQGIIEIP